MTTYARNVNNQAVDVVTVDPTTIFHADVAAQFIVVPNGTENGATFANGVWTNPVPVVPVVPPVVLPDLTAMQVYDAFTVVEEVAIDASTDPIVMVFAKRLARAFTSGTMVQQGMLSEGLTYLSVTNQQPATTPASTYILPARIPAILQGVPQ
jgi:hypothetical protein